MAGASPCSFRDGDGNSEELHRQLLVLWLLRQALPILGIVADIRFLWENIQVSLSLMRMGIEMRN